MSQDLKFKSNYNKHLLSGPLKAGSGPGDYFPVPPFSRGKCGCHHDSIYTKGVAGTRLAAQDSPDRAAWLLPSWLVEPELECRLACGGWHARGAAPQPLPVLLGISARATCLPTLLGSATGSPGNNLGEGGESADEQATGASEQNNRTETARENRAKMAASLPTHSSVLCPPSLVWSWIYLAGWAALKLLRPEEGEEEEDGERGRGWRKHKRQGKKGRMFNWISLETQSAKGILEKEHLEVAFCAYWGKQFQVLGAPKERGRSLVTIF